VCVQYYREYANYMNKKIKVIESLEELPNNTNDIFGLADLSDCLYIYKTDLFDYQLEDLSDKKDLWVITKKVDKKTKSCYNIIEVPKLEEWQIKDYVYSNLKGLDNKTLDNLCVIANYDINRLAIEVERLSIFSENERKFMYNKFNADGIYDDLTNLTVFNITNAIARRDVKELNEALKKIKNMDVSYMGFYILLYQLFRNIILIQLSPNPSPESTGLKSGQFYAIRNNNIGFYTKTQLTSIFELLTGIDKQIKTGNIDVNKLIDYLIVKVMTI